MKNAGKDLDKETRERKQKESNRNWRISILCVLAVMKKLNETTMIETWTTLVDSHFERVAWNPLRRRRRQTAQHCIHIW